MAAVQTFTKAGTKATTAAKLDKQVFGVEVTSHSLLKQAYVAYLANGRTSAGRTKTRGEISGGGRKPWKQKGTGRARFGSSRNPIWRGGGIVFGPTGEENYTHNMSTTMKRQAIRQALSMAANEDRLRIVEDFVSKDNKVKGSVTLLSKMDAKGSVLLVVDVRSDEIIRSTNNVADLRVITAKYLTVYDILNADVVVITQKALDVIHEWLATSSTAKAEAK